MGNTETMCKVQYKHVPYFKVHFCDYFLQDSFVKVDSFDADLLLFDTHFLNEPV